MLTSYPPLDSTFSNPVTVCPSLSETSPVHRCCFQLSPEQTWLLGCCPVIPQGDSVVPRTTPSGGGAGHPKDCQSKKTKPPPEAAMNLIEPEDDLISLIHNDAELGLCGYYYGSLSWVDASHLLRQCRVGTFLVRDSEHSSYLYTLSVQTRKGPTSCRIEYSNGRFRLDSSKDLLHKMPLFDCVPQLIDFYVQLPKQLKNSSTKAFSPVWLDMDEESTTDVPVQIYKPLYKRVPSLQHLCRVNIVRRIKEQQPSKPPRTMGDDSSVSNLSRTLEEDPQYKGLPNLIKDYLIQYPYSQ